MEVLRTTEDGVVYFFFLDQSKYSPYIVTIVPGDEGKNWLASRYHMQYVDLKQAHDHDMVFNGTTAASTEVKYQRNISRSDPGRFRGAARDTWNDSNACFTLYCGGPPTHSMFPTTIF